MSIYGIQGQLLEVTVVGCNKLRDTEWISRQDPYVCLEYGSTKFLTRTCTDGGKNPSFQEKFVFTLIEGLRELNVAVFNSNTLSHDDFIGSGKVQLQKVLSEGYDDSPWALQSKRGRYSGEVRLIIHYANCNASSIKPNTNCPSAPPYGTPTAHQVPFYSAPPQSQAFYPPPSPYNPSYPPTSSAYQPSAYFPPQPSSVYPPPTYPQSSVYPPQSSVYPPQSSVYPPQSSVYPPQSSVYPPQSSVYPPQPYPPPPQSQAYYPPGQYPGVYPPPPHY